MKNISAALFAISGILICATILGANVTAENQGAEIILIDGGKMRDVHFPHRRHQNTLGDCNVCHELFPAKMGSITEFKDRGKLKKNK